MAIERCRNCLTKPHRFCISINMDRVTLPSSYSKSRTFLINWLIVGLFLVKSIQVTFNIDKLLFVSYTRIFSPYSMAINLRFIICRSASVTLPKRKLSAFPTIGEHCYFFLVAAVSIHSNSFPCFPTESLELASPV